MGNVLVWGAVAATKTRKKNGKEKMGNPLIRGIGKESAKRTAKRKKKFPFVKRRHFVFCLRTAFFV